MKFFNQKKYPSKSEMKNISEKLEFPYQKVDN